MPLRDHRFDLDAMAERLNERTRLVFIANPNNPTGTMVGRRGGAVPRPLPGRGVVVMDEAYYEYVDDPDYPHSLDYVREGRNVVVLRTFSKIYGLAGLRVGYGIARPEIIHALNQVREPFNVNTLAQAAAVASLRGPGPGDAQPATNREGRDYFTGSSGGWACPTSRPRRTSSWWTCSGHARRSTKALLRRGVIVRTGDIYGLPTFLRVTIGPRRRMSGSSGSWRRCWAAA